MLTVTGTTSAESPDVVKGTTTLPPMKPLVFEQFPYAGAEPCWLLECFSRVGQSRRLYWSGKKNQIGFDDRGLEATFDVDKARRIPADMGDVARALADAANKAYPAIDGSRWFATQHEWIS